MPGRRKKRPLAVGGYVVLGQCPPDGRFDADSHLRVGMIGRVIHVYDDYWPGEASTVRVWWGRAPDYPNVIGEGWNIRERWLLPPESPEAIRILLGGPVAAG